MKKNVLIIVLSNIRHDARVRRQVLAVSEEHHVTIACLNADTSSTYDLLILPPLSFPIWKKAATSILLLLQINSLAYKILYNYRSFLKERLAGRHFDLIIANDVETLPLAFAWGKKAKVLFDAHEYAPRHFEDKLVWKIFFQRFNTWLCSKYIPLTAGMITVGKGLAQEYEKHFRVKPVVITNANNYFPLTPTPVAEDKIRLVHHGIINASRRLDLMIDLMGVLDSRFTLDLILLEPDNLSKKTRAYITEFKARIKRTDRIKLLPAVKSAEIVGIVNQYDMGVFLLPPVNFNYKNTLPNKFFDFIQARLGIAIGPTPEMAEIVHRYNNGVVSDDFSPQSLALKLNKLTKSDIEKFKQNSCSAANDLNAGHNAKILKEYIRAILDNSGTLQQL